jgi:hypothetical protein
MVVSFPNPLNTKFSLVRPAVANLALYDKISRKGWRRCLLTFVLAVD